MAGTQYPNSDRGREGDCRTTPDQGGSRTLSMTTRLLDAVTDIADLLKMTTALPGLIGRRNRQISESVAVLERSGNETPRSDPRRGDGRDTSPSLPSSL